MATEEYKKVYALTLPLSNISNDFKCQCNRAHLYAVNKNVNKNYPLCDYEIKQIGNYRNTHRKMPLAIAMSLQNWKLFSLISLKTEALHQIIKNQQRIKEEIEESHQCPTKVTTSHIK